MRHLWYLPPTTPSVRLWYYSKYLQVTVFHKTVKICEIIRTAQPAVSSNGRWNLNIRGSRRHAEQTELRAPPTLETAPTESQTNNNREKLTWWKEGQEDGETNPELDVQVDKRWTESMITYSGRRDRQFKLNTDAAIFRYCVCVCVCVPLVFLSHLHFHFHILFYILKCLWFGLVIGKWKDDLLSRFFLETDAGLFFLLWKIWFDLISF